MNSTAITWSSYSTAQRCRRAYWYQYCEGLTPIDQSSPSEALQIGDAVHRACAGEYVGDVPDDLQPIVGAMVGAWLMRWQDFHGPSPERQFESWVTEEILVDDVAVTLGAHCDEVRVLPDGTTQVVERKTSSHIDRNYIDRLALDQQIALQAHLVGTEQVLYDIIQKPNIKRRQPETVEEFEARRAAAAAKNKSGTTNVTINLGETLEEFQTRLVQWYRDRPDALMRCSLTLTEERRAAAATQIASLAAQLHRDHVAMIDIGTDETLDRLFPQSTQRCFDWQRRCEYWDLCESGNNDMVKGQLYQIRAKREGDPPNSNDLSELLADRHWEAGKPESKPKPEPKPKSETASVVDTIDPPGDDTTVTIRTGKTTITIHTKQ